MLQFFCTLVAQASPTVDLCPLARMVHDFVKQSTRNRLAIWAITKICVQSGNTATVNTSISLVSISIDYGITCVFIRWQHLCFARHRLTHRGPCQEAFCVFGQGPHGIKRLGSLLVAKCSKNARDIKIPSLAGIYVLASDFGFRRIFGV